MGEDHDPLDDVIFFPTRGCMHRIFGSMPLRFREKNMEEAYVASIDPLIKKTLRKAGRIFMCVIAVTMVWTMAFNFDYDPMPRSQMLQCAGNGLLILISILFQLRVELGEATIVVLITFLGAILLSLQRYRSAWITGDDYMLAYPKATVQEIMSDSTPIANLAALVTGFYLLLPIRCARSVYIVMAIPLLYMVFTCFLPAGTLEGGMTRRLLLAIRLCVIVIFGFAGRVNLETMHRSEFVRARRMMQDLTREKVLRVTAEHEAEGGPLSMRSRSNSITRTLNAPSEITSASLGLTSVIFGNMGPEMVAMQLRATKALGMQEHWVIAEEDLQLFLNKRLGKGSYGAVFLGRYLCADVAIKTSRSTTLEKRFQSLAQELRVLRRLRHPNIVVFYGACIMLDPADIVLVEEFVDGKDLRASLLSADILPDLFRRHRILLGIALALRYLAEQEPAIVHGDLKPNNILLDKTFTPKLCDFGISRFQAQKSTLGGTVRWMAPEVLCKAGASPDCSADIFSFGRIIFFVLIGKLPLDSMDNKTITELTRLDHVPELSWPETTAPLQTEGEELSQRCTGTNSQARPTAQVILEEMLSWSVDGSFSASAGEEGDSHPVPLGAALAGIRNCKSSQDHSSMLVSI